MPRNICTVWGRLGRGRGGSLKDDLINRRQGGGGQKSSIMKQHSLWTAPTVNITAGSWQKSPIR